MFDVADYYQPHEKSVMGVVDVCAYLQLVSMHAFAFRYLFLCLLMCICVKIFDFRFRYLSFPFPGFNFRIKEKFSENSWKFFNLKVRLDKKKQWKIFAFGIFNDFSVFVFDFRQEKITFVTPLKCSFCRIRN